MKVDFNWHSQDIETITWAREFVGISEEETDIIVEIKKFLLYMNGNCWTNKGETNFDVAQGSFVSAEVCDLVGLYLLSELQRNELDAETGKF